MSTAMQNLPYYFRCQKCGACCTNMLGKKFGPAITPYEKDMLVKLADYHHVAMNLRPLTMDFQGRITLYQFGEDRCSFLNQLGRCMIYARRPMFCRMFPLSPAGLSECKELRHMSHIKPKRVVWQDDQKKACIDYIKFVVPLCQQAAMRYDLNKGWEVNKPFEVKTCDADLRYADTYRTYTF